MTIRGKANPLVHTLAVLALVLVGPVAADDGGAATIEELIEQCKGKNSTHPTWPAFQLTLFQPWLPRIIRNLCLLLSKRVSVPP